jgi:hypothetical protein
LLDFIDALKFFDLTLGGSIAKRPCLIFATARKIFRFVLLPCRWSFEDPTFDHKSRVLLVDESFESFNLVDARIEFVESFIDGFVEGGNVLHEGGDFCFKVTVGD